ncbi:hypothetical protein ACJIZ3_000740 [Penstemon smallii]|uniref:Major facilitator superfamily (MFS) profile domain-containing protein n=1 Tax=Penstemon smallii TaxID=265156 RepID=A0ABD3U4P6_9LAMI
MDNWKNLIHLFVTVFLSYFSTLVVSPAIADVTMEAVCPGQDECSLAIYLTGFQQAVAGLGAVIMMPLIGNLSDAYGRKLLLTIPLTLSIIPLVIMSLKRSTEFFYAYYVLKTITSMVSEGGVLCLSLSYLADNVSEGKRVSAIGLLCGVVSAATVCGTLAARLLPTAQIFQVAAVVSIIAAGYMRVFLKETGNCRTDDALEQPILKPAGNEIGLVPMKKTDNVIHKIPLPKDIIRLLQSSLTVSLASFVAFFNSLGEAGIQAFLMYFLKARFHFQKDEYADICLITYIGATFSSMVLMPTLGPYLGEETLLCIGLFAGFLNMLLDSIAWSAWVPYASALFGTLLALANPSIRCIVSKQVGPYEQGIAQGCLMGIASLANVASPLIFSPLSALFLSDNAPFNFPGFSIFCVGLSWLIGFILSTMIKILPHLSRNRVVNQPCLLA